MPSELVIVDTCVWVSYFSKHSSATNQAVSSLLDDDRAAVIGPIVTELLMGIRNEEAADWIASRLNVMNPLPIEWDDWRKAAKIHRDLAAAGHALPLGDSLIAQIALRESCAVFTVDPHFRLISGLKLFTI
ncbi:MAG: PIN domain-containing protein [Planctomycetota bacterium]|jgi:predicted nucleic acid-binding protein|nr:PIN domain-containing protein [Planctomycetota bacterium]MDP6502869.1 PIN domain-containing protein [Planctomycetota bacterium]